MKLIKTNKEEGIPAINWTKVLVWISHTNTHTGPQNHSPVLAENSRSVMTRVCVVRKTQISRHCRQLKASFGICKVSQME